jgi:hypothetical protein
MSEFALYYRLDANDQIVDVGGKGWDAFARENGGVDAMRSRIIGTKLYAHVSGKVTRLYTWTMLDSVRRLGRPAVRPYRCDSPDLKRFMEMTIEDAGNGELLLSHRLIRTEPLRRRAHFSAVGGPTHKIFVRCSMCNRLNVDNGWLEPDIAASHPKLAELREDIPVIYSVCDACQVDVKNRVRGPK